MTRSYTTAIRTVSGMFRLPDLKIKRCNKRTWLRPKEKEAENKKFLTEFSKRMSTLIKLERSTLANGGWSLFLWLWIATISTINSEMNKAILDFFEKCICFTSLCLLSIMWNETSAIRNDCISCHEDSVFYCDLIRIVFTTVTCLLPFVFQNKTMSFRLIYCSMALIKS